MKRAMVGVVAAGLVLMGAGVALAAQQGSIPKLENGWARYYGKQRSAVRVHHSDWSGAQQYTDDAKIRVCRDRGSLRPDNCSPTTSFRYRRD